MQYSVAEQRRRHYLQLLDIVVYPTSAELEIAAMGSAQPAAASFPVKPSAFDDHTGTTVAAKPIVTPAPPPPLPASDEPGPTATLTVTATATATAGIVASTSADSASTPSYSHACLLLCAPSERGLPLLLDILRHVPALASADDEFLHSHLVSARQLAALSPRLLLTTDSTAATNSGALRIDIDLQRLQADPVAAKAALWQQLQALTHTAAA